MITYELTVAILAEVILFTLVLFFPFLVMLGLWQRGHLMSMVMSIIS
jgi:hypothetical protein